MHWLLNVRIDRPSFMVALAAIVLVAAVYLLARTPWRRGPVRAAAATVLGGITGFVVCWLVSDVWNTFGLPLTLMTRAWVAVAFAGTFLAVVNLRGTRWWRKIVAGIFVPVVVVTAAAGINVDYGAYRNLGDALGVVPVAALATQHLSPHPAAMDPLLGRHWQPPAGMPTHGTVGAVTIPGTVSHFTARPAVVYLPPAALVADPPTLPVVMLFSGQPGSPSDVFASGQVAATYDAYAAAHNGLAPIVVVADQLGVPLQNPMCVDSPLGHVATYLTVDVPAWLHAQFRVAEGPRYWSVGGYSEGGTCAVQFGTGHPELFGAFVAVLAEREPTIGPDTVAKAFGGSIAAYRAVQPLTMMTTHAPYRDTFAIFGTGASDAVFTRYAQELSTAAQRVGISTQLMVAPSSGHDWNTVRYVFASALPQLADRMGLGR